MSESPGSVHDQHIPASLAHAHTRLAFTPSYVAVGIYRLCTDKTLYIPIWNKCKHGLIRGLVVGLGWAGLTFGIQHSFVKTFLIKSPRVAGLSRDAIFGYKVPFSVATYATILFLGSQMTYILRFFLSKNIRIARARAWDQTVASRGKGADFWGPYVEEWQQPPTIGGWTWQKWVGSYLGRYIVARVILIPLNFYPFVGVVIAAYLKAVNTAQWLHRPYFQAKKMTPDQIAVFMEERKWDYRAFGFVAALVEGLPIIGLLFSVSNRIGAAMWAHDLEKRQHAFAAGELQPLPPHTLALNPASSSGAGGVLDVEMRPRRTEMGGAPGDLPRGFEGLEGEGRGEVHRRPSEESNVTGSWVDVDEHRSVGSGEL